MGGGREEGREAGGGGRGGQWCVAGEGGGGGGGMGGEEPVCVCKVHMTRKTHASGQITAYGSAKAVWVYSPVVIVICDGGRTRACPLPSRTFYFQRRSGQE